MGQTTSNLLYLVTIVCFVLALRFLSSAATARRGNWIWRGGSASLRGLNIAVFVSGLVLVGALKEGRS